MIRVCVSGSGSMGQLVLSTVEAEPGLEPVGVLDPLLPDGTYTSTAGTYPLRADPGELFALTSPDVVVDFTNADFTSILAGAALAGGVRPVIGTSGVDGETVELLRRGLAEQGIGGVVAANFALGAVLLMHLSTICARFFDAAEIIETHHDGKVDAPSGTALATARLMRAARGSDFVENVPDLEHIPGTRGGSEGGIPIHSMRLPGRVAHQQVIFGSTGQTLTLAHDSIGRESFMPGVVLAIGEVMKREGLVEGLETLIGLD
jgi:4-hydroxy-tetrahydrodipicolinate reductase